MKFELLYDCAQEIKEFLKRNISIKVQTSELIKKNVRYLIMIKEVEATKNIEKEDLDNVNETGMPIVDEEIEQIGRAHV